MLIKVGEAIRADAEVDKVVVGSNNAGMGGVSIRQCLGGSEDHTSVRSMIAREIWWNFVPEVMSPPESNSLS